MPTTTSLTTTYAGKEAGNYLLAAVLANSSTQFVTIKPNIDYKQVVKRLTTNINSFAAATCDFTPTNTVTIDERILTLEKFQVQLQLCKKDFLTDWDARAAQNGDLPTNLQEALVQEMIGKIAQINETIMWSGVNGTTGQYDGLITLIDADNTVNFVASPVALTVSNIIAKIELLLAEIPTAVENSIEKPLVYMNQKAFHLYRQANVATGNGWYTYNGAAVAPTFMGIYDIAICPGMPDNVMIAAQKSNLWWGTNVESDYNNIQVVDMEQFAEENVRFSAKFFAGAQYGFGNEIAAYGPGLS
jgi:hypothetical protein